MLTELLTSACSHDLTSAMLCSVARRQYLRMQGAINASVTMLGCWCATTVWMVLDGFHAHVTPSPTICLLRFCPGHHWVPSCLPIT